MWTVKLSKQVDDFLESLTGKYRSQVENALDDIAVDPYIGKQLLGELKGYWSLRSGDYRLIYLIKRTEIVVEVLRLQHRKEVYERLRRR